MGELVADVGAVAAAMTRIEEVAHDQALGRVVPQVSLCGSDEVVDAFVRAYRMIDQQDTNVSGSWHALARRTGRAVDELQQVDARLAAAIG